MGDFERIKDLIEITNYFMILIWNEEGIMPQVIKLYYVKYKLA